MEKKIVNVNELKSGDIVLINNPLFNKDSVGVVSSVIEIYKYCFSDNVGRKRSLGRNPNTNNIDFVYAKDEGAIGNEKIMQYGIMTDGEGDYNFTELDDISSWNVRVIDENHQLYNKDLASFGKQMDSMLSMFDSMFNEDEE